MRTNGEILQDHVDAAMSAGEVPYQANRRALKAIDIMLDEDTGKQEILVMLDGIDVFMTKLETLKDVASRAEKSILAAIR